MLKSSESLFPSGYPERVSQSALEFTKYNRIKADERLLGELNSDYFQRFGSMVHGVTTERCIPGKMRRGSGDELSIIARTLKEKKQLKDDRGY